MCEKYNISDIFDPYITHVIYNDLIKTRKLIGEDKFEYTSQEYHKNGVIYIVSGRHISLEEAKKYNKGSCKVCFGKGYKIIRIQKEKIRNVEDYMMLFSYDIKNASEEQKKIIIEKEKLNKYWRVVLPCTCTIKNMEKRGLSIIGNKEGNILIETTCKIKKDI
jgi:hypothetical protein